MDISQAMPFLTALAIGVAGWTIFHFASRFRRRFTRLFVKTLAAGLLITVVVAFLFLLLIDIMFGKHAPPIYSPDGRYVAVVTYALQGALGDDYAVVGLRPWWRPYTETVYSGLGNWDFKKNAPSDPEVQWLDATHLLIRYYDNRKENEGRGEPAICPSRLDRVEIPCERAP
jgi:hypothetical protein